jgi:hypothetical protein
MQMHHLPEETSSQAYGSQRIPPSLHLHLPNVVLVYVWADCVVVAAVNDITVFVLVDIEVRGSSLVCCVDTVPPSKQWCSWSPPITRLVSQP